MIYIFVPAPPQLWPIRPDGSLFCSDNMLVGFYNIESTLNVYNFALRLSTCKILLGRGCTERNPDHGIWHGVIIIWRPAWLIFFFV